MAKKLNKKNNAVSENKKANIQEASKEGSSFAVNNETKNILKEIEETLTHGNYRKTENESSVNLIDDDADAKVFNYQKEKVKKKKKVKKTYEKTTFAHKMKVLGILLVLGVFTGSGLGVWYFNFELRAKIDYSAYNPTDYIQSVNDTFSKNNINATDKDGLSWVDLAQSNGLTPASITPADNFILAQHNLTFADSYVIDGNGYVDSTGVRQSIISRKKYNGSYYTFESISPSKISFIDDIVLCDKYVKGSKKVSLYQSKNTKPTSSDWKYSKDLNSEDYLLESGSLPNSITPYIISEKTVLEGFNDASIIEFNSEEGTYSYTMKLDSTTSVLNYAKQVKRTGGLGSYPEFTSISFTVVIDGDWNLLSFNISEKYSAVKGIRAQCSGVLNYTITKNIEVEMPV